MREALAAQLRRTSGPNAVLTGDFNTTPWSFAMRRQDAVFLPLVRRTIAQFSFPARLAGRRWVVPLLPIDHLYASPAWKLARLQRVRIPGSDHFASEAVLWLDRAAPGPPKAS
jgi:endonuclease/exonuclease/phosphatase (EEP) superfamily protein YafD